MPTTGNSSRCRRTCIRAPGQCPEVTPPGPGAREFALTRPCARQPRVVPRAEFGRVTHVLEETAARGDLPERTAMSLALRVEPRLEGFNQRPPCAGEVSGPEQCGDGVDRELRFRAVGRCAGVVEAVVIVRADHLEHVTVAARYERCAPVDQAVVDLGLRDHARELSAYRYHRLIVEQGARAVAGRVY